MMLSGALSGLVGWIEVYGVHFRLLEDRRRVWRSCGRHYVARENVTDRYSVRVVFHFCSPCGRCDDAADDGYPYSIVDIIQGLVIVLLITQPMIQQKLQARKARGIYVE